MAGSVLYATEQLSDINKARPRSDALYVDSSRPYSFMHSFFIVTNSAFLFCERLNLDSFVLYRVLFLAVGSESELDH